MKPHHILLAEDDADDRELFLEAISLVDPAIEVEMVENGELLMRHLSGSSAFPDCIFIDLNMPKKGGKECLAKIRRDEKTKMIPMIIYSTSVNARDVEETFRGGACCFIRKPATFAELQVLLGKALTLQPRRSDPRNLKQTFVLNAR